MYLTGGWAYWQFKWQNDFTTCATGGNGVAQGFYDFDGSLQVSKVR